MKTRLHLLAVPVMLALAACRPGAAEYTEIEAPKQLRVDRASQQMTLAFAPDEAVLSPSEVARLHRMARSGLIKPEDRVTIAAAGDPVLAQWRTDAIERELAPYRIIATGRPLAGVPRDRAIVAVGHYMVTLPPCPNWSPLLTSEFTNAKAPNLGC